MRVLTVIFALAGMLALTYWAWQSGTAALFQARQARSFRNPAPPAASLTAPAAPSLTIPAVPDQPTQSAPEMPTAAEPPSPSVGSPVAELTIPRLGLSAVVVEGAEARQLKLGPGHIRGTPLPGSGGNFAIAAHRDTFFRPLRQIRRNDSIIVETHRGRFQYTVVSTEIVGRSHVRVLLPAGREMLTLVTCYPFNFVGAAPNRFVVHAESGDAVEAAHQR